jgi:hypothetical protein
MKTIKLAAFTIFMVSLLLIVGCRGGGLVGSGNTVTRTFDYDDFTTLQVHHGFYVDVTKSDEFSIEIIIDDNLLEYLEVDKSGSTLKVRLQKPPEYRNVTLEANITMPDVSKLDLSGGSHTEITGFNLSHDLTIELSEGSHLDGNISATNVDMEVSGGSHLELAGSADNLAVVGSGGSHLTMGSFPANDATVKIIGGSEATINVNGTLDVEVSGGSRVVYDGEPAIGDVNLSGGSTFKKK